jgi:hypothetical protein
MTFFRQAKKVLSAIKRAFCPQSTFERCTNSKRVFDFLLSLCFAKETGQMPKKIYQICHKTEKTPIYPELPPMRLATHEQRLEKI